MKKEKQYVLFNFYMPVKLAVNQYFYSTQGKVEKNSYLHRLFL